MLLDGADVLHRFGNDAVDRGAKVLAGEGDDRLPRQRRRDAQIRHGLDEREFLLVLPDATNFGARLHAADLHQRVREGDRGRLRARIAELIVDRDVGRVIDRAA